MGFSVTYDHTLQKTGHPVRSALHKLQWGGLVVGSVTTSESPLLYVFAFCSLEHPSPIVRCVSSEIPLTMTMGRYESGSRIVYCQSSAKILLATTTATVSETVLKQILEKVAGIIYLF